MEEKIEKEVAGLPTDKVSTLNDLNVLSSGLGMKEITTPKQEKPKDLIPSIDKFLEMTKNPVKKLRHGQGYDNLLGLTYIGTFPESSFGHYGISREKAIRAINESNAIEGQIALDIDILGGFTDPLTDRTLGHIRELLEQLNNEKYIKNKSLSALAKSTLSISSLYLDFQEDLDRVFFVFWIIGTYLRALFTWYPYLCFEGLRDVGKSTALEFLSHTCFNGGGDVSGGHTEADLHKAAASTMGFFAIDHLEERLKSDDKRQVLNEFLENAWKVNSYVSKRDQNTGEQLRLYLACSVALGTRKTTETIGEKGLIIRMQETGNKELRQRSVTMYKDVKFSNIEKELMAMALNYQDKIKEAYESIEVISGLGREYNKFLPFLAIAKVIDYETNNENDYFSQLKQYAMNYRKARKSEHEDTEEILLRIILREPIEKASYTDLSELMKQEGYEYYSWQTAKADLNKLGIIKKYNKKQSPITLSLDLERAKNRAEARGIIVNDNNEENPECLFKPDEIIKEDIKQIDYRNTTTIEKNILGLLADQQEHNYSSIIEDLKKTSNKDEITGTLKDMRVKGWIQ